MTTNQEIIQRLNADYCDVKALVEEAQWGNLRKAENGDEIQSHAEDILYYLSELIGCIEEINEQI
jgi:hypothetical protein